MRPHSLVRAMSAIAGCSLFLGILSALAFTASSSQPVSETPNPVPSPELEPSEVVRIQVEALRSNGPLNEGIVLTYRFASPDNKRATGPLDRFTKMVRSAPYDRLLNHLDTRYGELVVSGGEASQRVVIVDTRGEELAYLWVLSRQTKGSFKDCWMTDAVIPEEREVRRRVAQQFGLEHTVSSASG